MEASKTNATQILVDTIKTLSIDAIEKAKSGHPGLPMGMADAASVLWADHLTVDPSAPRFFDRDRFVLSAGHGSMLIYALLHLSGFDLTIDDIKQFRQLGSRTPGHPEVDITPGVETTTGPLGQGFANAVGMAMAEAHLAARFNRPGLPLVDHYTLGICSDGDLHEGVASEAASLAGHLGLGKLVFLYDDNGITIEGETSLAWSEDVALRFQSYGWHTLKVDGHDRQAVSEAIAAAKQVTDKPSLILCKTHIGHGSPNKQDSPDSHGSPLGEDEIKLVKEKMNWPGTAPFFVPDGAPQAFEALRQRGQAKREAWEKVWAEYQKKHPEEAAVFARMMAGEVPADLDWKDLGLSEKPTATRSSSGKILNELAQILPEIWGGSADLAASTKTLLDGESSFSKEEPAGRNLHYGIREHGMGAIMNGMALHGGVIPYGATFLTFSDYMRGAIRVAALMKQKVVYVFTHDSIFLGEDGPTHQSIEHAMALRLIPGLSVWRPADWRETAVAWVEAMKTEGPSALLLTRQNLAPIPKSGDGAERGGYIVRKESEPDVILIGTGSELQLCVDAATRLVREGIRVRVVSMPSVERFLAQPVAYREEILPPSCRVRVSVEAGRTWGWQEIVGSFGVSVGIDRFGESAPAEVLAEHFGFTADQVVKTAKEALQDFGEQSHAMKEELS